MKEGNIQEVMIKMLKGKRKMKEFYVYAWYREDYGTPFYLHFKTITPTTTERTDVPKE